MASDLRLRPPSLEDEHRARAAHDELQCGGYNFFLGDDLELPWADLVLQLRRQRCGLEVPPGRVRSAFLIAWAGEQIVGRASIRFELNEYLALAGGHIGYAVLPAHRRRGHATEILRQSLVVARSEGVDDVLVTCEVDNVASRIVIERCGGSFQSIVHDPREGVAKRRYWIR